MSIEEQGGTIESRAAVANTVAVGAAEWTPQPSLNVSRGGLTDVSLDGKAYAIGGFKTGFEELASVEVVTVLDEVSDQWELIEPMTRARGNSGAAAARGEVYVLGGFIGGEPVDFVEVFDPSSGRWRPGRPLPGARGAPGSAAIGDRIYVIGGFDGEASTNAVDVYDVRLDIWRPARSMPTKRRLLKVAELGGRLYAIGGIASNGKRVDTVERYDPDADTWEEVASMNAGRGNPGVATVGGHIFAVGGAGLVDGRAEALRTSEAYDPEADRWKLLEALLPVGRASLSAARTLKAQREGIIAFGGFEGTAENPVASSRVEALTVKSAS